MPEDGLLPDEAWAQFGSRPFGLYVHVPFCTVRCGYCDFNTYTAEELGDEVGAGRATYAEAAIQEIRFARQVLGHRDVEIDTIFFGGGTPTLLKSVDLGAIVASAAAEFGLADDVEITTEANPDSVALWDLEELRGAGFNRISFGMQSAVDHVLRTLDRTHDPVNVARAVEAVRGAGMQVSLDLIYGTPGESLADWRASLEAAVALGPDHLSAYALVIEEGTRMHGQVRRGELPAPEDDDEADKYELADELLAQAGYGWYEISNWARSEHARCRHNLAYWRGGDWWGIGPGAHSHVGGVRWWNVKHPRAYADRLSQGLSPVHAREVLDPDERRDEDVLLGIRLAEGLPVDRLDPEGRRAVAGLVADGLVDGRAALHGRVVLTLRGRLLADTAVHRLLVP